MIITPKHTIKLCYVPNFANSPIHFSLGTTIIWVRVEVEDKREYAKLATKIDYREIR